MDQREKETGKNGTNECTALGRKAVIGKQIGNIDHGKLDTAT
jgi:hypothetical protein